MTKVSTEEMIDDLGRSGYFLESRILSRLHGRNYKNTPNNSYPDSNTGKSRELDSIFPFYLSKRTIGWFVIYKQTI